MGMRKKVEMVSYFGSILRVQLRNLLEDVFCEAIYFNAFCFSAILAPTLSHL